MTRERWSAVERYFSEQSIEDDPLLDRVLAASAAAGLPPINVSPVEGRLLQLLAQMQAARAIASTSSGRSS